MYTFVPALTLAPEACQSAKLFGEFPWPHNWIKLVWLFVFKAQKGA